MANTFHQLNYTSAAFLIRFTIIFLVSPATSKSDDVPFSSNLSPQTLGLAHEKLTFLHFYYHDTFGGRNPTAITVAAAPSANFSTLAFGSVVVFDDPLTVKPELSSKLVGRAQGIYVAASQSDLTLEMIFHFAFLEGEYNGSTLSILGRNSVLSSVREMPIVGGSGVFRFARGFAQARTQTFSQQAGIAVLEFSVHVLHF